MMHRTNNNTLLGDVQSNTMIGGGGHNNNGNSFSTPKPRNNNNNQNNTNTQNSSGFGQRTRSFALPTPNSQRTLRPQSGSSSSSSSMLKPQNNNNCYLNSNNSNNGGAITSTPDTVVANNNNNNNSASRFRTTSTRTLQQQASSNNNNNNNNSIISPSKCLFHNMSNADFSNKKNLIGHGDKLAACYFTNWDNNNQDENAGGLQQQLLLPPLCAHSPHTHPVLTVVLDLDETLVNNRCPDRTTAILRPHVIHFLDYVRTRHRGLELVLWTASTDDTARPVIRQLSADSGVCPFDHVICRNDIWFTPGPVHTKDLRLLGRDMDRVVVVDNSAQCVKFNPHNAILVQDFVKQRPAEDETLVCTGKMITHLHSNLLSRNQSVPNTLRMLASDGSGLCEYQQLFLNEAWGALESMDHIDPILIPPHGHYIKSGVIFPRNTLNNNNNNQQQQQQQQNNNNNNMVSSQQQQQQKSTVRTNSVSIVDTNRNITIKNRRSCGGTSSSSSSSVSRHRNNNNNNCGTGGDGVRCGEDSVERCDEDEATTACFVVQQDEKENDETVIMPSQDAAAPSTQPSQQTKNTNNNNNKNNTSTHCYYQTSQNAPDSPCGEDSQCEIIH